MNQTYIRRVLAAHKLPENLAPYDLGSRAHKSNEKGHAYLPLSAVYVDAHGLVWIRPTVVRHENLYPPNNQLSNAEALVVYANGRVHLTLRQRDVPTLPVERHNPVDSIAVDSLEIVTRHTTVHPA